MRRREFITLLGGATIAWPLAARAQQAALPVIGFLSSASPDDYTIRLRAFRQGLKDAGYVEGQNVTVEYRWAEDQYSRLPLLAAELVRRKVNVIVAGGGTPSAVAAKAATATIPIIFAVAVDPVKTGFVANLKRPGGNLTGVTNLNVEVAQKRLELLHELLPSALVISPDIFFNAHTEQLAALSLRHAMPTIFQQRTFVAAGGLLSYGSDESEYYRLVGIQAGKILKGEKPADLPVMQSTKVELMINLKTAKALGISVPLPLLGRADEVIE